MTRLDKISLEIAQYEALTSRYESRRPLFRAEPLKDETVESGWNIFVDDWGREILDGYNRVFLELQKMGQSKRERRLILAIEKSLPARAECARFCTSSPHGEFGAIPDWMLPGSRESDAVTAAPVWN